MDIRLLRPINYRKIGEILTVSDGVGELWILQKKAERVEPSNEVEAMVPAPATSGGRGRVRKGTSRKVALTP